MKKVKALVAFSNGIIAMEQYEVRELPTDMANDLIAAGICVEISGGGSGGGVLVVNFVYDDETVTLDKTWQEIHDADTVTIYDSVDGVKGYLILDSVRTRINLVSGDTEYVVGLYSCSAGAVTYFVASSADDYPTYYEG